MEGFVVIGDMVATGLLALGITRGARGRALASVVPLLIWGMMAAALAAALSAIPTFGGFLLLALGAGFGATFGALIAFSARAERMPLYLTGLLVLYGVTGVFLSLSVMETSAIFWQSRMGSSNAERLASGAVALLSGSLVAGGGCAMFIRRLPAGPVAMLLRTTPLYRLLLAALILVLLGRLMASGGGLVLFSMVSCLSMVLGALVVLPAREADLWPFAILLTALSGLATAAIGFALASLLLIIAGGLASASMAQLLNSVCRESGRRPRDLLLGNPR
ncbi:NAD(P)(+) transhydrogenase (Re/Si-specific) subunit beta [Rhizobium sp. S-51]|uniref:NAD(P)(+) transhydrogenase (Re/Si-specific) subunit beta n=1 Tax=Rhizobium terricola TaxID=2728849 RepID=A0A7Y0ASD4_9HYPH|nr:NAD(P)(+) transhydrogenase (Re/Si-specific) subunit beta [Rhizobium terricola]NML72563.1 NAD(P)(+) transhydrogenase (Re/Si-specific) subunit beta [Rhizobium terricola]